LYFVSICLKKKHRIARMARCTVQAKEMNETTTYNI